MRPLAGVFAFVLCAFVAEGQDVLSLGSGNPHVPVYILDRSGTPLGADATAIRGFAFKVMFDGGAISEISFARTGIAASASVLFETALQGDGWFSVVVSFSQPLLLDLNATAPGNQIGMLTVTATGATVLRFDPPSAVLSNESGSVQETVAAGTLSLGNGSVVANLTFTDDPLVPGTLIKLIHITELRAAVNAMRASAGLPAMSDDGTIALGQIVRASHLTNLRTALNEARVALGMPALTFTDSPPVSIKAIHVQELRDGVE